MGWWVEQSKQYIEGEGQWVGWWVEQSKQYMGGGGGWSNQREGVVGGAIKAVYRRGGTVGEMVGGAIKAVYGRGWWVEQSKGGGGGWSNQNIV